MNEMSVVYNTLLTTEHGILKQRIKPVGPFGPTGTERDVVQGTLQWSLQPLCLVFQCLRTVPLPRRCTFPRFDTFME